MAPPTAAGAAVVLLLQPTCVGAVPRAAKGGLLASLVLAASPPRATYESSSRKEIRRGKRPSEGGRRNSSTVASVPRAFRVRVAPSVVSSVLRTRPPVSSPRHPHCPSPGYFSTSPSCLDSRAAFSAPSQQLQKASSSLEEDSPTHHHLPPSSKIKELMRSPQLWSPDFKPPRYPIVLCHGLYGYGVKGQIHYWANVQDVLKECGAEVLVVEVPSTGSIEERAKVLHETLEKEMAGRDINLVAHSMGGLDSRWLISHIKNRSYRVRSLTSIATPHRGSPVMDWFSATLGLGVPVEDTLRKILPDDAPPPPKFSPALALSFPLLAPLAPSTPSSSSEDASKSSAASSLSILNPLPFLHSIRAWLLNAFDSPAYYNLTIAYMAKFNAATPDDPNVKYFSIAARATSITPLFPLWYTQIVLDETAKSGMAEPEGFAGDKYEGNDGMVSVSSAKHGEFLGVVDDCNHWELRARNNFLERLLFRYPSFLTRSPPAFASVYSHPPVPPSAFIAKPHLRPLRIPPLLPAGTPKNPSASDPSASRTTIKPQGDEGPLLVEPSPSEIVSPPPSGGWTLPDLNAAITSYLATTKRFIPFLKASGETHETAAAKSAADLTPPAPVKEKEAWITMSSLMRLVPSSHKKKSSSSSVKGGGGVDAKARAEREGPAEGFELETFFRAVVLNLRNNQL